MYGAWRSREHFSVAGSDPMYTSVNGHVLAEVARAAVGPGHGPSPVLAELLGDGGWQLVYFTEPSRLRPITRAQGRKYEPVRAGAIRWSSCRPRLAGVPVGMSEVLRKLHQVIIKSHEGLRRGGTATRAWAGFIASHTCSIGCRMVSEDPSATCGTEGDGLFS